VEIIFGLRFSECGNWMMRYVEIGDSRGFGPKCRLTVLFWVTINYIYLNFVLMSCVGDTRQV
jgi:hypothetical protein